MTEPIATADPLVSILHTPEDRGLNVNQYVVSDHKNIFYVDGDKIFKTNIQTSKRSLFYNLKDSPYYVDSVFFDNAGNLCFLGKSGYNEGEIPDDRVFSFRGHTSKTLINYEGFSVDKVTKEYIFFHKRDDSNDIMRYEFTSGKIDPVVEGFNDYFMQFLQSMPFIIYELEGSGVNYTCGYIKNYLTNETARLYDSTHYYKVASDEGSLVIYDRFNEYGVPIEIYGLSDTFGKIQIQVPLEQIADSHGLGFSLSDFICDGKELQFIFNNYLYILDINTGKIADKYILMKDFTIGCSCTGRIYNKKWYILTQEPIKYSYTKYGQPEVEIQQGICSFDILSHEKQQVWKGDPTINNGYSSEQVFFIDDGYVWLYWDNNLDKAIRLSDLEKKTVK